MRKPPQRFLQNDRQQDDTFDDDERLYRRYMPEYGTDLEIDVIELPDISCERARYAKSYDVLWSEDGTFDDWGVLAFPVKVVPFELRRDGLYCYTFSVDHAPDKKNYPHTEVRAYEDGRHLGRSTIAKMDRGASLRFRQKLLDFAEVIIAPGKYDWSKVEDN